MRWPFIFRTCELTIYFSSPDFAVYSLSPWVGNWFSEPMSWPFIARAHGLAICFSSPWVGHFFPEPMNWSSIYHPWVCYLVFWTQGLTIDYLSPWVGNLCFKPMSWPFIIRTMSLPFIFRTHDLAIYFSNAWVGQLFFEPRVGNAFFELVDKIVRVFGSLRTHVARKILENAKCIMPQEGWEKDVYYVTKSHPGRPKPCFLWGRCTVTSAIAVCFFSIPDPKAQPEVFGK